MKVTNRHIVTEMVGIAYRIFEVLELNNGEVYCVVKPDGGKYMITVERFLDMQQNEFPEEVYY